MNLTQDYRDKNQIQGTTMRGVMQLRDNIRLKPLSYIPASYPTGRRWFVLFVNAARMKWVEKRLSPRDFKGDGENRFLPCFSLERDIIEQGFETFVPATRYFAKRRGKIREIIDPIFGCYIFVRLDLNKDNWERLSYDYSSGIGIEGVHDLLNNLNIPVCVPDDKMALLYNAQKAGLFDKKTPFDPGDDVQIKEGQWEGLVGKVLSASPRKRIKILLGALGKMEIDPEFLEKLEPVPHS